MNIEETRSLLTHHIDLANKAARWLERSQRKCEHIKISESISDDDFDNLETLTSRFARLADILIQKVFRAVDMVQLEPSGTTIDVINRAEKRGLAAPNKLRLIRELRNKIAHEYEDSDLLKLYDLINQMTPDLLSIFQNAVAYVKNQKLA